VWWGDSGMLSPVALFGSLPLSAAPRRGWDTHQHVVYRFGEGNSSSGVKQGASRYTGNRTGVVVFTS